MTIEEMKDKKKEKGYSYEQMADLSGIPLGTIQKIFSGNFNRQKTQHRRGKMVGFSFGTAFYRTA